MEKINLREIKKAINENEVVKEMKKGRHNGCFLWNYESIEYLGWRDTAYGKLEIYEVVIRFNTKNDHNAFKFQVNHYKDERTYTVFWNGSLRLD